MATSRWLALCQAVCQQLFLNTLAFKATDFCQLLNVSLHFQIFCWPRPRPPPPTAAVTCVATSVTRLMRLRAGGLTAPTAAVTCVATSAARLMRLRAVKNANPVNPEQSWLFMSIL
eukprot:365374-Chlamydomonas_euryale.AAC.7